LFSKQDRAARRQAAAAGGTEGLLRTAVIDLTKKGELKNAQLLVAQEHANGPQWVSIRIRRLQDRRGRVQRGSRLRSQADDEPT
jgi:hypothetical protein